MNNRVLSRFIKIVGTTLALFVFGWLIIDHFFVSPAPGDFEVKAGNIHLDIKEYGKALEDYDKALELAPDHRGALMGKAITYHMSSRPRQAESQYSYLIKTLGKSLLDDDPTGKAVLAGAYANRGVLRDQSGRHELALKDYIAALKIDEDAVSGPSLIDKILYIPDPSSVRKRAEYLYKQFKLPENERLLKVPEIDRKQRMFKP